MTWRFGETRRERDERRWQASKRARDESKSLEFARLRGIQEEKERQDKQAHEDEFERLKELVRKHREEPKAILNVVPHECEVCKKRQERKSRRRGMTKTILKWVMGACFRLGYPLALIYAVIEGHIPLPI